MTLERTWSDEERKDMHINPIKEFVERRGIAPYSPHSVSHTMTTFNVVQYNPTWAGEDTPTRVTLNIELCL